MAFEGVDENVVTILTDDECWDLLRGEEFGRLAYHLASEVHLVPVNYLVDGDRLVIRTAEGSKLLGIHMSEDVAFEVDRIEDDRAASVVLRARAHELTGADARKADELPLRPWVPTTKFSFIAIEPFEMSGRRFRLDRLPPPVRGSS